MFVNSFDGLAKDAKGVVFNGYILLIESWLIFFYSKHKLSIVFLKVDFCMIYSSVSSFDFLFLLFENIYIKLISKVLLFNFIHVFSIYLSNGLLYYNILFNKKVYKKCFNKCLFNSALLFFLL